MGVARTLILLLLVALGGATAGFFGRELLPGGLVPSSTPAPTDEPSGAAVTTLGRLEPGSEMIAIGGPAGTRIDRLEVKEGDWVEKDAVLAYVDSYAEMAAARDHARSQWEEARKRLAAETAYGQAVIEETKLKLRQAQEVALFGIQAQDAEVRRCQAALDKARLDLKRGQRMLKDTAISQSQYDTTALLVRESEEQFERNKSTLAQLTQDREVKMEQARAEVRSAEAALTKAQIATQVGPLAEGLKLAETRLERTVLRAPLAGEILKILTRPGESVGQEPILKMGNTRAMYAVAEVYETDVGRVHPRQRATITSKAFPDQKLTGRVERVSTLVHRKDVLRLDPTADADARVLEARIRLDDSQLAARYNYLQVDVRISVGDR